MSIAIGKRDKDRMAKVLNSDHESVEDAAQAVLEEAFTIYMEKAKFTVVGQMYFAPGGGWIDPEDAAAMKVALGAYGTENQAMAAAASLVNSHPTGEQFRAWALPVWRGTPNAYFKKRNEERKAQIVKDGGGTRAEGLIRALTARLAWLEANPLAHPSEFPDPHDFSITAEDRAGKVQRSEWRETNVV